MLEASNSDWKVNFELLEVIKSKLEAMSKELKRSENNYNLQHKEFQNLVFKKLLITWLKITSIVLFTIIQMNQ